MVCLFVRTDLAHPVPRMTRRTQLALHQREKCRFQLPCIAQGKSCLWNPAQSASKSDRICPAAGRMRRLENAGASIALRLPAVPEVSRESRRYAGLTGTRQLARLRDGYR